MAWISTSHIRNVRHSGGRVSFCALWAVTLAACVANGPPSVVTASGTATAPTTLPVAPPSKPPQHPVAIALSETADRFADGGVRMRLTPRPDGTGQLSLDMWAVPRLFGAYAQTNVVVLLVGEDGRITGEKAQRCTKIQRGLTTSGSYDCAVEASFSVSQMMPADHVFVLNRLCSWQTLNGEVRQASPCAGRGDTVDLVRQFISTDLPTVLGSTALASGDEVAVGNNWRGRSLR